MTAATTASLAVPTQTRPAIGFLLKLLHVPKDITVLMEHFYQSHVLRTL